MNEDVIIKLLDIVKTLPHWFIMLGLTVLLIRKVCDNNIRVFILRIPRRSASG
jgi:hypothetical protein